MNKKKLPVDVADPTFMNTTKAAAVFALAVVQVNVVSTAAVVVSSFTAPLYALEALVSVLSSIKLFVKLTVAASVDGFASIASVKAGWSVFVGPVVAVVERLVTLEPVPLLSVTSSVGVPLKPVYSTTAALSVLLVV